MWGGGGGGGVGGGGGGGGDATLPIRHRVGKFESIYSAVSAKVRWLKMNRIMKFKEKITVAHKCKT